MANYRAIAARIARAHGLDPRLFLRQIAAESGFNPSARSPAGAIGIAQIVPRYHPGVNPNDPVASLRYAAQLDAANLRKYGNWKDVLSVYNSGRPWAEGQKIAETSGYVSKILGGSDPGASIGPSAAPTATTTAPQASSRAPLPFSSPSSPPNFSKLLTLVNQVRSGNQDASSGPASSPLVAAVASSSYDPHWISLAPGADRPGAHTHNDILSFATRVAKTYGTPLRIGTGTNHNQYVAGTRRQSAHWIGEAVDIPSSGAALTRLGQAALIAAGMPAAQARKQRGGLYNVGGFQIIFNSNIGGNHYNHLHLGRRG